MPLQKYLWEKKNQNTRSTWQMPKSVCSSSEEPNVASVESTKSVEARSIWKSKPKKRWKTTDQQIIHWNGKG